MAGTGNERLIFPLQHGDECHFNVVKVCSQDPHNEAPFRQANEVGFDV